DAFGATPAIPPYFHESALLWQEIMSIDGAKTIQRIAFKNDRSHPLSAYIKERTFATASVHKYLSWAITGASFFKPSSKRRQKINAMLKQGDKQLGSYSHKRLLIVPLDHPDAITPGNVYREIFSIKKTFLQYMPYVAYANAWGLPSLTVPVGTDENDMPIGVQIISSNGNEEAIFQLGE